jgi:hypothetical protein
MDFLRRIRDWVAGQFAGEVPEDVAICEFDCRKPQCREGEWESCIRRSGRARGELMPAEAATREVEADTTPESDVVYHDSEWL